MMRKPKANQETYDVRIEGKPWMRGLSRVQAFEAIEAAFAELADPNADMLFAIEAEGQSVFVMDAIMWEACCESPDVMKAYLEMGWE